MLLAEAFAQNYYVSAGGSDSNDGLTAEKPFATIQKGSDMVKPGGTVFIMNGRYNRTTYGSVLEFKKSGTASAYITFKNYPGHNPVISASGSSWNAVVIDGSYVILDGLELAGINASLTLAGAQDAYQKSYGSPAVFNANYNTNAISIGATGSTTPHHIIMRNCKVHDFPGGGIGVAAADYITVENNIVYNNSWYTMYATSGISVFGPKPIDNVTTYKIFIRGNTCYNNFTQVKWRRGNQSTDKLSDGNGIILDANNGTQNRPVYTGRTLVENNVSYNNGGGGIHAFQAARIDIINNTAYNNGKIVGYAEIGAIISTDCKIYNNIMYARNGGSINSKFNNTNVTYDWNLYFNGTPEVKGPNDKTGNPLFVRLANDGSADFRITSSSPARDAGSWSFYSVKDKLGVTRGGARPDIGAYEFEGASPVASVQDVYTDAISNDWGDWSWGSTNNFGNTSPVRVGTKSIRTDFTSTYAGLSLRKGTGVSATNLTSVKFWVYSTTARTLTFQTQSEDNSGASPEVSFTTTANAWKEITVTRSELGNPTVIKRIKFNGKNFTGEFIFDEIRLNLSSASRIAGEKVATLEESSFDKSVAIYPNPVASEMHVKLNARKGEKLSVSIVTLQGRGMKTVNVIAAQDGENEVIVNVESLEKGTYLVRYGNQGKVKSSLVVIE
jgi:parallel beta-helix repeat protein